MASLEEANARIAQLQQQFEQLQARVPDQQNDPAPAANALYRQPKIAAFYAEDPVSWFDQAEISLRNASIRNSSSMADFIAEKLDREAFNAIRDVVTLKPRPGDVFQQLKNRLIQTYGTSAESRLRQLIKGQISIIGKPSLILNRLQSLNTGASADILRTVFLDQLPAQCKATLAISEDTDLHRLVQMSDNIVEAMESSQFHISSASNPQVHAATSNQSGSSSIGATLKRIESRLGSVEKWVNALQGDSSTYPSGGKPRRSRSSSRDSLGLCFTHRKYPDNPRTWREWCSKYGEWLKQNPQQKN